MVIGRRSLLLAGAALPVAAHAQCVTDTPAVDACRGGVRITSPPGVTLDLSFMTPGTLDPRITFTRASTATYFDSTGTMQTATTNTPRWDYNPGTHALNGLLIEEARTNLAINSADASNASWTKANGVVAAPVVTGNQAVAPDGTTTAARVVYPAVSGAGAFSNLASGGPVVTANQYTWSVWLRGNAGGEQLYLFCTADAVTYYRTPVTLTTAWQRFSLTTSSNLTATNWFFEVGTDLRDTTGQTSKPAQTVFVWGAQIELGAFPTSYIPTTAATVTRSADVATMPTAAWYNAASQSVVWEAMRAASLAFGYGFVLSDGSANNRLQLGVVGTLPVTTLQSGGVQSVNNPETTAMTLGVPFKLGTSTTAGRHMSYVNGIASLNVTAGIVMPVGVNRVDFGQFFTTLSLNGWMRRVRYWPRALTNAELQSVTT